jgi:uncharacterized protein (DUF58 family)
LAASNSDLDTYKGKISTTEPTGLILNWVGLLILLIILILAAWGGLTIIVILLSLVLVAAGISMLWTRYSLNKVNYQRLLSATRAFPGESIELKLRLENRKLLPLPWVRVDDEIPVDFAPDTTLPPSEYTGYGILSKDAALLWYTAISWHHTLYCGKRGYYRLGPLKATSGDIFGFYSRSMTSKTRDHVIVYPKIFPIQKLTIPSLYPLGETKAEKRLFADPTRPIGIREYRPHDSLRHIHWKATARHQSLQVKVFEPTTTLKVVIFLAGDSFPVDGEDAEEDFELGVSTAASIAYYVNEQGSQVGLYSNSHMADSENPVRVRPGSGIDQLITILEALAKVKHSSSIPLEKFIQNERGNLPYGATLVLVLSRPGKSLGALVATLKESGYKIVVLQVGGPVQETGISSANWHRIEPRQDIYDKEKQPAMKIDEQDV